MEDYLEDNANVIQYNSFVIEPDPIQSYSKFDQIRRFEAQERAREARRQQEHSKDGMIEALIVLGLLAMIIIPFLIWLYYKSGICNPHMEQQNRRYSQVEGVISPSYSRRGSMSLYHNHHVRDPAFVDSVRPVLPLKGSGLKCSTKPSCVCATKDEICTSKKKSYRNLQNEVYAPAKV